MGVLANIAAAVAPRNEAPVPYTSSRGSFTFGTGTGGSPSEQLAAMGTQPTLYAVVRGLAEGVAKWEWWLERDNPRAQPGDTPERVLSHPALDLWANPNPFMDTGTLMETGQQHLELAGKAFLLVVRDPRATVPLELWPVRPDRILPVPDPKEFLTGWLYVSPDGEKIPLERDEVLWMRYPHPTDPYEGMAPVQAAMTDLAAARYAAQWNANFFINSAEPGGFIKTTTDLTDTQFRKLRERWNEQHRGVAAAHRVAILEGGYEWESNAFSMRDLQFSELRNVNDEQVRRAYRFPKPMLGDVDDVNRANADAGEYVFGSWLIDPRLDRWAGVLSQLLKLFGTVGTGLRWCHEDPSPPNRDQDNKDRDSRVAAAVAYIEQGFNPTEALEAFGLPPVTYGLPGADPDRDLLTKLVIGAPTLAPLILPMLGFDIGATSEDALAAVTAPVKALAPWIRSATDDQVDRVARDWDDALDSLLADWPAITEDQRAELRDQIVDAVDGGDLDALASLTVDSTAAAALLAAAMDDLAEVAAGRVVEEAAAQGVTVDPVPAEGLATFAAVSAGLLAAGLAAAAGREALRVHRDGMSGAEVADAVDGHLASLSDAAVRTEAGGALSTAQNQSRLATLREAPDAVYQANEINDTNRCGPCSEINGTTFDSLDDAAAAYPTGGYLRCEGRQRCRGIVTADWSNVEDRGLVAPWVRTNGHQPALPAGVG